MSVRPVWWCRQRQVISLTGVRNEKGGDTEGFPAIWMHNQLKSALRDNSVYPGYKSHIEVHFQRPQGKQTRKGPDAHDDC
jgi:hypothetical protein